MTEDEDLSRDGYHRAWFTAENFDSAVANGYTRVQDRHGQDIVQQCTRADPSLQAPVYMHLFERSLAQSMPPAAPPPPRAPYLVAAVSQGTAIIALTVWKDYVVLATSTGVYLMANSEDGFVPMKVTTGERSE